MPLAQDRETWSVIVLYQGTDVRERAMRVCDHMMRQFWSEIEFNVAWWQFASLEDENLAGQALKQAADADILMVAVRDEGDVPAGANRWLEQAVALRGRHEGAFIALFGGEEGGARRAGEKSDALFRRLAQQGGMDYLTDLTEALPGGLPRSLDTYSQRADRHSSIMDDILGHLPPPGLTA